MGGTGNGGGKVVGCATLPPVAPTPPPLPVPPPVQLKFLVGNNLKPPWPPTLSPYYLPAMVMPLTRVSCITIVAAILMSTISHGSDMPDNQASSRRRSDFLCICLAGKITAEERTVKIVDKGFGIFFIVISDFQAPENQRKSLRKMIDTQQ